MTRIVKKYSSFPEEAGDFKKEKSFKKLSEMVFKRRFSTSSSDEDKKFERIFQILMGDEKKKTFFSLIFLVYQDCCIGQVDPKDLKKLDLVYFISTVPGMKEFYKDLDRKDLKNEEIRDSFVLLLMTYWLDCKKRKERVGET